MLVAEGYFDVTGRLHHFAVRRGETEPINGFGDGRMAHLVILITHHRAEVALVSQLHGFHAKACAENTIQRGRRTAALQMAEHAAARFFTGALCDFTRDNVADSAEAKFAPFDIAFDLLSISRSRSFRHYHQSAEITGGIPFFYRGSDFIVIKRDLGNKNHTGAPGDPAVKRDPAGVTPHRFNDHDAFVTCSGGVQTIERVHYHRAPGIKSER